ncbi:MAG: hypothetical protein H7A38_04650 [Chlamydiales bacterium]|nr:hypothetical protein [Chlamydiales bacterium]
MSTICQQISLAAYQAFHPETMNFEARIAPSNQRHVKFHLIPQRTSFGYLASVISVACRFFAYLLGYALPSTIEVPVEQLGQSSFQVGNHTIAVTRKFMDPTSPFVQKEEIFLKSNREEYTGYVGTGKYDRMNQRLLREDGTSPFGDPFDFYVPLMKVSDLMGPYLSLPASLFKGKKEEETVRFLLDGTFHEYTLRQQSHPHPDGKQNFETFMETLKKNCDQQERFLFPADIPEGTMTYKWDRLRSLSSFDPITGTLTPADPSVLKDLEEWSSQATPFSSPYQDNEQMFLEAPGLNLDDLTVYVSHRHLFLYAKCKPLSSNIERLIQDGMPKEYFLLITFHHRPDFSKMKICFPNQTEAGDHNGILQLNFASRFPQAEAQLR